MLQKVKAFDLNNNHLPLKAAGAFVGATLGAVLVWVIVQSLVAEEEEYFFNSEESAEDEE